MAKGERRGRSGGWDLASTEHTHTAATSRIQLCSHKGRDGTFFFFVFNEKSISSSSAAAGSGAGSAGASSASASALGFFFCVGSRAGHEHAERTSSAPCSMPLAARPRLPSSSAAPMHMGKTRAAAHLLLETEIN